jgi:hypothetical protein
MPNPFPGVNPYIEATGDLWVGFHNVLISDLSKLLNRALKPRGYAAFVEKRIDLVDTDETDSERVPDAGASSTAVLEPASATVRNPSLDAVPVAYIEVRALPGQRLITGIEILSPANKAGGGRRQYAFKRATLLANGVNLVEIDLLLGGRRPPVVGRFPPGEFCAVVSRADEQPACEVYAWPTRDRLPLVRIPLRPDDADATVDLAAGYAAAYDDGPYDVALPYDRPLAGPLSDADRAWVAERVAAMTG